MVSIPFAYNHISIPAYLIFFSFCVIVTPRPQAPSHQVLSSAHCTCTSQHTLLPHSNVCILTVGQSLKIWLNPGTHAHWFMPVWAPWSHYYSLTQSMVLSLGRFPVPGTSQTLPTLLIFFTDLDHLPLFFSGIWILSKFFKTQWRSPFLCGAFPELYILESTSLPCIVHCLV